MKGGHGVMEWWPSPGATCRDSSESVLMIRFGGKLNIGFTNQVWAKEYWSIGKRYMWNSFVF
jgi:hypothetical protein